MDEEQLKEQYGQSYNIKENAEFVDQIVNEDYV